MRVFEHKLAAFLLSTSFRNLVWLKGEIESCDYLVNAIKEELGRSEDSVNELTRVLFIVDKLVLSANNGNGSLGNEPGLEHYMVQL